MSAAVILQLVTTFGPSAVQFVTQLIQLAESNANVTSAQWAALIASLEQKPSDVATSALQNAGVDTTTPGAQAVIGLAK